jgi:exodeoxyribonuclease VIII
MTNAEYHASGAVSKSVLDMIHKSPAYYQYCRENPRQQTDSMLLGSVVHKLVLETETFASEFVIEPYCDKRTKAGKELYKQFLDSLGDGMTAVPPDVYDTAKAMAEAVKAHPVAAKLLTDGKPEESYFWEQDGIKCSCRPDWLRSDGIVVDLKTTKDASPDGFQKSAYNFRYYVQAWWYIHGLKLLGIDATEFIFIAVESAAPYTVCVYAADDLYYKLGEIEAAEDFQTYKECMKSGNWYGYEKEPEIHSLSVPEWVARRIELL